MAQMLSQQISNTLNKVSEVFSIFVREASKKASSSTSYSGKRKPKRRGIKVHANQFVTAGKILATQRRIQFHPGLHAGFGRNGNIFAIEAGKVMVTCEKADMDWDHCWVQKHYAGRIGQTIYKKYINIIPEPQHQRFKLIDKV